MSSNEIANGTPKAQKHVLIVNRSMLNEVEIDWPNCSSRYHDSKGRKLPYFNLNPELTDTLLNRYSGRPLQRPRTVSNHG
jgi:hypothetical protein